MERSEWRPLVFLGLLFALQILLNLYAVHTVVLAHFLIPGDRLTLRKLAGVLIAYAGIVLLFAHQIGDGATTILAERTIYLACAVQRFDPVKLLLSQVLIGTAIFVVVSLVFEPSPTRWTGRLAAFFLTQPIFGVLAAALVAGDPLTLDLLLASAAVAVGIGLTSR